MCDSPYHNECRGKLSFLALLAWIGIVLVLLFLYGCRAERYREVWEVPLNAIDEAVDNSPAFIEGEWLEECWWHLFKDDQLEAFILQALRQKRSIDIADAEVLMAAARAEILGSPLWPTIGLDGDVTRFRYSRNGLFGSLPQTAGTFPFSFTQYEFSLNFSYEIDWWGKNRAVLKAAIGALQARIAESAEARLMVSTLVARSYFLIQKSLARTAIAQRKADNARQILELTKQRSRAKLGTKISVNAAENEYYLAREFFLSLSQEMQLEKNVLHALIAGSFDEEIEPIEYFASARQPFPLPENIALDLIARRPDITAQIWRIQEAAYQVQVAKAQFYPNLNLLAFGGFQSLNSRNLLDGNSKYGQAGAAIHLPIFQAGALQGNLRVSRQEFQIAISQYEEMVINALKEVLDAITSIRIWEERIHEYQQAVGAARSNYLLNEQLLKNHINSKFEVLRAEQAWLTAEDYQIQAHAALLLAKINLIKALGGGYDSN